MKKTGRFIVVEGLEGAGKSTAVHTIQQFLKPVVPELLVTREPGGTKIGESLRHLIKEKMAGEQLESRSELLLLYAARIQLVEQIIKPALTRGCWVVSDRFELSTFAYQGGGRGLDKAFIDELSQFSLQGFKPDLTLLLDLKPEEGLQRVVKRGAVDRIEQESLIFFDKVHQMYLNMSKTMPNVITIDANQELLSVQQSIIEHLENYVAHHV